MTIVGAGATLLAVALATPARATPAVGAAPAVSTPAVAPPAVGATPPGTAPAVSTPSIATPAAAAALPAPPESPAQSFTVLASGDVLVHQRGRLVAGAAQAGRATGTGYDFSGVFAPVAPLVRAADLAICHLETPVAEPGGPFTGYPVFAAQPQILDALVATGYDVCSTASNHAIDKGFAGIARTADAMDTAGLRHTGTFRSEPESITPLILDVAGVRVGHVSWTYGLNGIREPNDKQWAVNDFNANRPDVSGILADAGRARRAGAQVVIVSVHCCVEYQHDPTPAQRAIATALLGSPDVDLLLGHHAHVVQPLERINGKWVAYGLGNHVAGQVGAARNDSVLARFTFTRGADGRFTVSSVDAVPTLIRRGASGVEVVPTTENDPSYRRVAEVLDRRDALANGLVLNRSPG